jgi:alkylation response protein AidB-like acyl-CoA dehydrogenase
VDFNLTDEQQALRTSARTLSVSQCFPYLAARPERPISAEELKELFSMVEPLGVLSARTPPELGGSGMSCVEYGIVMEQLPPALSVAVQAHEGTAARIAASGNVDLQTRFLPPLISGAAIAATATSEPNVGSDPRAVSATATVEGDQFRITGQKLWVTNGTVADILMVIAKIQRDDGTSETGRLIVDRRETPYSAREVEATGLKQGHLAEIFFDGLLVPIANEVRDGGAFHQQMTSSWLANRAMLGLIASGIARRALEASIRYAKQRKQFGAVIGSFQLVQELIVEIAMIADISQLLAYRALGAIDRGDRPHAETSMAKLYGTHAAVRACQLAIEVHGSFGLTREYGMEQMLRDALMLNFPDGTRQIQQLILGRELLGIRAFRPTGTSESGT